MINFTQVLVFFVAVQCVYVVRCKPLLGGISFKRDFDIVFKPFPFKPIIFSKEKLTPFGIFGTRHTIFKRSVNGNVPVDNLENKNVILNIPLEMNGKDLSRLPVAKKESLIVSSTGILPAPVLPPLTPDLPQPVNLYTDISRASLVDSYLNAVESYPAVAPPLKDKAPPPFAGNSLESDIPKSDSPKSDFDKTSNSILRGSKLALHLGNVFFQALTQLFANARKTYKQLSSSPIK